MADQVERKKSYRWVSASHVNYDGADWDTDSGSDLESNDPRNAKPSTIAEPLPTLPEQNGSRQDHVDVETQKEHKAPSTPHLQNSLGGNPEHDAQDGTRLKETPMMANIVSPSMQSSSPLMSTPNLNVSSSKMSSGKKSPSRSINHDLDNLMKQISKEMTPLLPSKEKFNDQSSVSNDSLHDDPEIFTSARATQSPFQHPDNIQRSSGPTDVEQDVPRNQHSSIGQQSLNSSTSKSDGDEESLRVSKNGYFEEYMDSDHSGSDDDAQDDDSVISVEEHNEQININGDDSLSTKNSHQGGANQIQDTVEDASTFQNPDLEVDEKISQEENKAMHYTNQVANQGEEQQDTTEKTPVPLQLSEHNNYSELSIPDTISSHDHSSDELQSNGEEEQVLPEHSQQHDDRSHHQDTESNVTNMYDDDTLSFTQSVGYEQESAILPEVEENADFKFSNKEHRTSIIESSEDDDYHQNIKDAGHATDNGSDGSSIKVSKNGYFSEMFDYDQNDRDIEGNKHTEQTNNVDTDTLSGIGGNLAENSPDRSETSMKQKDTNVIDRGDAEIDDGSVPSEHADIDGNTTDEDTNDMTTSRKSVNMGKWKPDTDSLRNDFVQETAKKAVPEGFVLDKDGKLVDLTPSSMKPRVVSTYSEIESGWNVFPSQTGENDDLETIKDTKTLYDNSTIYNVPGLIAKNQNLPPLPEKMMPTQEEVDDDYKPSMSLVASAPSHLNEDGLGISQPNSKDTAKATSNAENMPKLDTCKILLAKTSNKTKYTQLNEYSQALSEYDSGIQTWISFSLKSTSNSDKDYLFQNYKQNKHVKEAYAKADDISKKYTVSNTVASVNQNVNQIRKKVFHHGIKPKSLFSTISKGVKL
ncbi:Fyv8p KNAG_0G00840 [Huiozyma naganishii CBS 8797]|uniref:Protein FYV8 n=1 Tax=Huiozyma naganishii (strain ATCC MYA-139 / BCRC 22969 / CBS 8797 / KCTC 17520 / NBRC 10181 / NCYC 3082 / Yp74L-3) TaxID=1071383 RepID=J7R8E3_HUIN7|nr:hypothetical protein KNAG_0G00840 [Kazachstania naganishii CBS 8797]CCK71140.1 hypothetical protein KNAG_0G00840 [Kazachstania naganishii CBS 8797]